MTGMWRKRPAVIIAVTSATVVDGPAVCSSVVINWAAVISSVRAPCSARLRITSRSLTMPSTWPALSITSTAPIRRAVSCCTTSATVAEGETRATSVPFCFRIAATVMAILRYGKRWTLRLPDTGLQTPG